MTLAFLANVRRYFLPCHVLAMTSTFINPMIYAFMYTSFRQNLRKLARRAVRTIYCWDDMNGQPGSSLRASDISAWRAIEAALAAERLERGLVRYTCNRRTVNLPMRQRSSNGSGVRISAHEEGMQCLIGGSGLIVEAPVHY